MDVMLDIETLANSSNSAITQIGAAIFSRKTGDIIDTFKINVDAQSCVNLGMETGVATIEWWMKQSDEARKSIFAKPNKKIYYALEDFTTFIKKNWVAYHGGEIKLADPGDYANIEDYFRSEDIKLWCHATFDEPNMDNAYRRCGLRSPWHYRSVRDIRTLTDLAEFTPPRNTGVAHDALDDALHQIKYVVAAMQKLYATETVIGQENYF